MRNNDYAILIIIVFIILIAIWYHNVNIKNIDSMYVEGKIENYNGHNSNSLNYQQIIKYEDNSIYLTNNDALVFYGNIDKQYNYFSINGYIYDILSENERIKIMASIADPISIADFYSIPYGTILVVILTPNLLFYNEIEKKISREFKNHNTKIFPIIIPTDFYNPNYRYSIVSEVILKNYGQNLPVYNTRLYSSNNVKMYDKYIPLLKKNNLSSVSEHKILSKNIWEKKCLDITKLENINVIKHIDTLPYLTSKECIATKTYCKENNYDITYITTDNIYLGGDEYIFIVYADHTISGLSMMSLINIYDLDQNKIVETFITGDNSYKFIDNKNILSNIIIPNKSYKNIKIEEHIFINFETKTAPNINTILPMQVYLCN